MEFPIYEGMDTVQIVQRRETKTIPVINKFLCENRLN